MTNYTIMASFRLFPFSQARVFTVLIVTGVDYVGHTYVQVQMYRPVCECISAIVDESGTCSWFWGHVDAFSVVP